MSVAGADARARRLGGAGPLNEPLLTLAVFGAALLTALATGLGALPMLVARDPSARLLGIADGVAAGVMAAASVGLIVEGVDVGVGRTALGALLGVALIMLVRRRIPGGDGVHVAGLSGAGAAQALLVLGVMTAHSFAEGVAVGVAFGGEQAFGLAITLAIAIHNIPEGLAISLVMVPRGASVASAARWSVVSSLPQPLMAVPAFLFVSFFAPALPVGLGIAAGAMLWMVAAELAPEAVRNAPRRQVGVAATIAFAAMLALQLLITG